MIFRWNMGSTLGNIEPYADQYCCYPQQVDYTVVPPACIILILFHFSLVKNKVPIGLSACWDLAAKYPYVESEIHRDPSFSQTLIGGSKPNIGDISNSIFFWPGVAKFTFLWHREIHQPALVRNKNQPPRISTWSSYLYISGWWFQPLWKIWKSNGIIVPNIWKVIKFMFQTTNQPYLSGLHSPI